MATKVKLSIKPLQEAIECVHLASGAAFRIAPLSGERDQELTRQHTDYAGTLDVYRFSLDVCKECLKGWKGVGDATGELACNEQNVSLFVQAHAVTIVPWILRQARSLEHYRQAEVEAAKNV